MKILYVEDDPQEARRVKEAIASSQLRADVVVIESESDFVAQLASIAQSKPDLIIIDIMLKWADPSPKLRLEDIPPEVIAEGFYTAGLRCLKRLRDHTDTEKIPVILYTALNPKNFVEYTVVLKELQFDKLIAAIRQALDARPK